MPEVTKKALENGQRLKYRDFNGNFVEVEYFIDRKFGITGLSFYRVSDDKPFREYIMNESDIERFLLDLFDNKQNNNIKKSVEANGKIWHTPDPRLIEIKEKNEDIFS